MSRRLRIEEEKAKQLLLEKDVVDKVKVLHERIFGPLVWRRLQSGIRIQDLDAKHYDEVLDIIMDSYPKEDVVFKNTKFSEDTDAQRSFRDRLLFNMKDQSSIIAIDEGNNDIVAGTILLKTVNKRNFGRVFSRSMLTDGKTYRSIMDFINFINKKVDIFEEFQCEGYLRFYLVCIRPEYRRKGLGYQLMNVGLDIARHLRLPVAMGIFDSYKLQKLAKKLGMKILYEIDYGTWTDKAGELLFCDAGAGNYSCAAMAGKVPPPPEPEPPPPKPESEKEGKKTRGEKRKEKKK